MIDEKTRLGSRLASKWLGNLELEKTNSALEKTRRATEKSGPTLEKAMCAREMSRPTLERQGVQDNCKTMSCPIGRVADSSMLLQYFCYRGKATMLTFNEKL